MLIPRSSSGVRIGTLTSLGALIGALAGALLPLGALDAQVTRQRVDTTFAFEKGGTVHLALVSGDIRVVTGTGNTIRILATTERGRLETSLSRSRVSIQARSVGGRMGETRYELTVPVGTRVSADAVSGDISVSGTTTEVEAESVSGDIRIEDGAGIVTGESVSGNVQLRRVSGRIDASSVSGSIDVDGAAGELDMESVSGSLVVRRSTLRSMRAESVSGDISYDGTLSRDGDFRFTSHSGDVRLSVPSNGGAALELETWSGNIASDFPLTLQPGEASGGRRRRMQFTIGTGGARIAAETFSGNITIRRAPARNDNEE